VVRGAKNLRVIAGTVGGQRLTVPDTVRPTTDRVKESVFGALGAACLDDAVVLDAYAGIGALAIEALSRGAGRAVLVERSPVAVAAIRRNLDRTGLTRRARVFAGPVARVLRRSPPPEAPFDLVFFDPPYESDTATVAAELTLLAEPGWLAPGATVVVERPGREEPPSPPAGWELAWRRHYGDTLVVALTVP
jgi:16S rRNA (guanine966-N2)-methyltransferase